MSLVLCFTGQPGKGAGVLLGACADRGKSVGLREVLPEEVTLGLRVE